MFTDMTLWTDLQPASQAVLKPVQQGALHPLNFGNRGSKSRLAMIFGWPMLLVGLLGTMGLRRKGSRLRLLSGLAVVMVLCGSSLVMTGCAGPGIYVPVLTPAYTPTCSLNPAPYTGTPPTPATYPPPCGYPIKVTVTGAGLTATTTVYFNVSSPGISGQE
jgi:hypothetical protein